MGGSHISDPGISWGQDAYLLGATGARGETVGRRLPFRMPTGVEFRISSPVRAIVGSRRGDSIPTHFEMEVWAANSDAITHATIQAQRADGTRLNASSGRIIGGTGDRAERARFVSETLLHFRGLSDWWDEMARFLVRVYFEDPCLGGDTYLDQYAPLEGRE